MEETRRRVPKFMASMAYPYMNGVLHAGHAFTLSKVEFAVGFEKMRGKRTLFPLGFHCTGMPIRACADKLAREAEMFGTEYTNVPEPDEDDFADLEIGNEDLRSEDGSSRFRGKKTKAAAKQGGAKYQFEIMLQLGITRKEIFKFADPKHWLEYFPPLCQQDCIKFGARIDWRRSMITTDMNPYYDKFVRWNIQRLKDLGRIKFGERYTIYSEKDGQPCMDHDRQSGEGVTPQEYTTIKMEVIQFAHDTIKSKLKPHMKCYFLAATLRPETLYGQTCCFVSPNVDYGIFDNGDSYYITTERAYKNMTFQKLTPYRGVSKLEALVNGSKFIGSRVKAPLTQYRELRVLPMSSIIGTRGTGIVTCVPSDSPDDFITCEELKKKPDHYGINPAWILEPVPVINCKYGDQCARSLCEELKIQSSKETDKLSYAKEVAYREGFYNGVILLGPYKGERVEIAKVKVKQDLIDASIAFIYSEPESPVISRSGDTCVVSLEDQWYVDYGEPEWKSQALEALNSMVQMTQATFHAFENVLEWLKNWAVCRTYGLGTRLPWDEKYLVESLSDSTIYQAFYTICHLLHKDFYGAEMAELGITPEQMTPEVFDYIFLHRDDVVTDIPVAKLERMRREFEYFYPLDMSISGKDLIPNHLTFFIYTHTAIFPKEFWPKGIRANGHLLLNNNKMSKSTGNFMTLHDIVSKFGADASRIALADAGDTVDDANFEESTANSAVLRLHTLKEWCEEVMNGNIVLRHKGSFINEEDNIYNTHPYPSESNYDYLDKGYYLMDRCFENEMKVLVQETYKHYSQSNYKMALKSGFFDFLALRDFYRDTIGVMHKDLVMEFIRYQALLLTPIAPHFSEYLWREILQNEGTIQTQKFPLVTESYSEGNRGLDPILSIRFEYVRSLIRQVREVENAMLKKKKGVAQLDTSRPTRIRLFIARDFPDWQVKYMKLGKLLFDRGCLKDIDNLKVILSRDLQRAMPFMMHLIQRLDHEPPEVVFDPEFQYDEVRMIHQLNGKLMHSTQFVKVIETEIIYFSHTDTEVVGRDSRIIPVTKAVLKGVPGQPVVTLSNLI
jgi:leucyl-tRNA synthetase